MVPPTTSKESTTTTTAGHHNRETFGFVTLVVVLLIVSLVTTIANVVIIYKLRLIPGFSFFDFASDRVVFHKDAFIDRILLGQGRISGLKTVTGNIEVKVGDERAASWLRVNSDGVQISSQRGFEVRSPTTGRRLFPFDFSSVPLETIKTLSVPSGVRDVKLVRSPVDEDLNVAAKERLRIRGNGGVVFEGKQATLDGESIFLSSINSSIHLDAHRGVFLDMDMFRAKVVRPAASDSSAGTTGESSSPPPVPNQPPPTRIPQYQLCVCAKNGRLFRIPVKDATSSCADARFPQSENPCVE